MHTTLYSYNSGNVAYAYGVLLLEQQLQPILPKEFVVLPKRNIPNEKREYCLKAMRCIY